MYCREVDSRRLDVHFPGGKVEFKVIFKLGGVNKIFLIVCARMSFHNPDPCAQDFTGLFRGYLYECKGSKFFL